MKYDLWYKIKASCEDLYETGTVACNHTPFNEAWVFLDPFIDGVFLSIEALNRAKLAADLFYGVNSVKTKSCECGKEKHKFFSHSHWCPLYSDSGGLKL